MSQLRLAKAIDVQDFPGCAAVVNDTPPETQCQETEIDEVGGAMTDGLATITDVGAFVGIDLAGKKITITAPVGEAGTFGVISNTDDVLLTDQTFGTTDAAVAYTVHEEAQVYLQRNQSSFQRFIEDLGNAHTTINGQLYTDVLTGPLADACSDTYAPE
ncbi:hypothetical protein ES707_19620 [subsurface metagenome]